MPLVMLVTKVCTSRPDAKKDVTWHVAMRPGKRKELDKENDPIDALIDQVEKIKASIRAKVEHPFWVIKRQFGYTKVRYRGLKKNTLQLKTLFALSSLWMVRRQLLAAQGCVRLKTGKGPRRRQERPRGNPKARPTCRKKGRPLRHLKTAAL